MWIFVLDPDLYPEGTCHLFLRIEEKLDPLFLALAQPCPSPAPLSPLSPASPQWPSSKAAFLLRSWLADNLTKSLNKATGGRRLIKMNLLLCLGPGCHLSAALSLQKAKQNSCAHTHSRSPAHAQRNSACQGCNPKESKIPPGSHIYFVLPPLPG